MLISKAQPDNSWAACFPSALRFADMRKSAFYLSEKADFRERVSGG